jgi:hypothetical protein
MRLNKRSAIALAGVAAVGAGGLYAGSLSVSTPAKSGAGSVAIQASCTSAATVSPGAATYDSSLQKFAYSTVTVSGSLSGCTYHEAAVTVYDIGSGAAISTSTTRHAISAAEVTAGEFPVTLATPVDAGISNSNYRYGLLIQSSTTHDTVSSIAGTQGYYGINLTWSAPTDQGGLNPTGYQIEYGLGASPSSWTTAYENTQSVSTSQFISGLTPGQQYSFRITAWNPHGLASNSATGFVTAVPYQAPGAPTSVAVATGSAVGELVVSWTAPVSDGYKTITGYEIELTTKANYDANPNIGWFNAGSAASSSASVYASAGTQYYARVKATNGVEGSYGVSSTFAAAHS